MQSMGKHTRLFAVEVVDIGTELAPKSDLTIFNNKLSSTAAGDTWPWLKLPLPLHFTVPFAYLWNEIYLLLF